MTEKQKQAYLRSLISTSNREIANLYKNFDAFIEKVTDPFKDMSGWDKLRYWAGGTIFNFLDGGWKTITGFVSGTINAAFKLWEDLDAINRQPGFVGGAQPNIFGTGISDEEFARRNQERGNAFSAFLGSIGETFALSGISLGATAQNLADETLELLGVETNWNTQWAIDATRAIVANSARENYYLKTGEIDPLKVFVGVEGRGGYITPESMDAITKDALENYDTYSQYLDDSTSQFYKDSAKFVNDAKKFFDGFIDNEIVEYITGNDIAKELYKNNELYQAFVGTISSIAAVITSRFIAKITPVENRAFYGQVVFGAQILGNTFTEAMEQGANIRDAWQFAVVNALIETGIEQLGGANFGGNGLPKITDFDAVTRFFKTVGKNAVEEGFEEIASEFLTPAFDIYNLKPEQQMNPEELKRLQNEGTIKRLFIAFASGAASGGFFGAYQYLKNLNTLENRITLWEEAKKIKVTDKNRAKAISIAREQAQKLLAALNNPKTKGYDANGDLKVLTQQEKMGYLVQTGLGDLVQIDWDNSTVQSQSAEDIKKAIELGTIVFQINPNINFNDTLFKARYGSLLEDPNSIRYIEADEYAINDNASNGGIQLENAEVSDTNPDAPFTLVSLKEGVGLPLNENGQIILKMAKEYKVPIVIVGAKGTQQAEKNKGRVAFYRNGVIYVNQDAEGLNSKTIRDELARHEIIHLLAKNNPEAYQRLANLIRENIDIKPLEVTDANGEKSIVIDVKPKPGSEKLFALLEKGGFVEKLKRAYDSLLGKYLRQAFEKFGPLDQLPPDQLKQVYEALSAIVAEQLIEEATAYFIEIVVKDTNNFLNALKGVSSSLFETIKNLLQENKVIREQTKGFGKKERVAVQRAFKGLTKGVSQYVKETSTLDFLIKRALAGTEGDTSFIFTPEAVAKYGEEALVEALIKRKFNEIKTAQDGQQGTEDDGVASSTPKTTKRTIQVRNKETGQMDEVALDDIVIFDIPGLMNKLTGKLEGAAAVEQAVQSERKKFIENFDVNRLFGALSERLTKEQLKGMGDLDIANDIYRYIDASKLVVSLNYYKKQLEEEFDSLETLIETFDPTQEEEKQKAVAERNKKEKAILAVRLITHIVETIKLVSVEVYDDIEEANRFAEKYIKKFLTETTLFDSKKIQMDIDVLDLAFGKEVFPSTADQENPRLKRALGGINRITLMDALFGKTVQLSPEVKKVFVARAMFSAFKELTLDGKSNLKGAVGKGVAIRRAGSTVEIRAVTAIFQSLKTFLSKYAPLLEFRTNEWKNSGWQTTSITTPGGLSLELDLSKEILEITNGVYDGSRNPDYYNKRLSIMAGYDSLLEALLSGTTKYIDEAGNERVRVFNREDWDYDILEIDNEDNLPLGVKIVIYPTQRLIQAQIDKVKEQEAKRLQKVNKLETETLDLETREDVDAFFRSTEYSIFNFAETLAIYVSGEEIDPISQRPEYDTVNKFVEKTTFYAINENPSVAPFEQAFEDEDSETFNKQIKLLNPFADNSSQDNVGRILTVPQNAYFNQSIIRDEKGRLIVLYHGSQETFDAFTFRFMGQQGTAAGPGIYFAADPGISLAYTDQDGYDEFSIQERQELAETTSQVRPFYVDIRQPIIQNNDPDYDGFDMGSAVALDEDGRLLLNLNVERSKNNQFETRFTKQELKAILLNIFPLVRQFGIQNEKEAIALLFYERQDRDGNTIAVFNETKTEWTEYSGYEFFQLVRNGAFDNLTNEEFAERLLGNNLYYEKEKVYFIPMSFGSSKNLSPTIFKNMLHMLFREAFFDANPNAIKTVKVLLTKLKNYLLAADTKKVMSMDGRNENLFQKVYDGLSSWSLIPNYISPSLNQGSTREEQQQAYIQFIINKIDAYVERESEYMDGREFPIYKTVNGKKVFGATGYQQFTYYFENLLMFYVTIMGGAPTDNKDFDLEILPDESEKSLPSEFYQHLYMGWDKLSGSFLPTFYRSLQAYISDNKAFEQKSVFDTIPDARKLLDFRKLAEVIRKATGFDGVVDVRELRDSEFQSNLTKKTRSTIEFGNDKKHRLHYIAWFQSQVKSTTNPYPYAEGLTPYDAYDEEGSFENTPNPVYNEDGQVLLFPIFNAKNINESIEKASQVAPVIHVYVPITFATTAKGMALIDSKYKIANINIGSSSNLEKYSTANGPLANTVYLNPLQVNVSETKTERQRYAVLTLVNKNYQKFANIPDLRLKKDLWQAEGNVNFDYVYVPAIKNRLQAFIDKNLSTPEQEASFKYDTLISLSSQNADEGEVPLIIRYNTQKVIETIKEGKTLNFVLVNSSQIDEYSYSQFSVTDGNILLRNAFMSNRYSTMGLKDVLRYLSEYKPEEAVTEEEEEKLKNTDLGFEEESMDKITYYDDLGDYEKKFFNDALNKVNKESSVISNYTGPLGALRNSISIETFSNGRSYLPQLISSKGNIPEVKLEQDGSFVISNENGMVKFVQENDFFLLTEINVIPSNNTKNDTSTRYGGREKDRRAISRLLKEASERLDNVRIKTQDKDIIRAAESAGYNVVVAEGDTTSFKEAIKISEFQEVTLESTYENYVALTVVNYKGIRIPFYLSMNLNEKFKREATWLPHLGLIPEKGSDGSRIKAIDTFSAKDQRSFFGSVLISAISAYLKQTLGTYEVFKEIISDIKSEEANLENFRSVAYHYGDLGKAEYQGRMTGDRSTGHYGTGTYFVSEKAHNGGYGATYSNRPGYAVDLSGYNLFVPPSSYVGKELHDSLKVLNNKPDNLPEVVEALQKLASIFGVSEAEIKRLYDTKVVPFRIQTTVENSNDRTIDTASTLMVKALGFEGIDVRGLNALDNFGYGTVVYSLQPNTPIVKINDVADLRPNSILQQDLEKVNSTLNVTEDTKENSRTRYEEIIDQRIRAFDEVFLFETINSEEFKQQKVNALLRGENLVGTPFDMESMDKTTSVSPEQQKLEATMKRIFGEYFFAKGLQLNKKGQYVLTNKGIYNSKVSPNEVTIRINNNVDGTFSGKIYAINVPYGKHTIQFSTGSSNEFKGFRILKLSELTPEQKIVYDFLISTGISFVFYYQDNTSTGGFSMPITGFNVSFINTYYGFSKLGDTLLHENFHEIFKVDPIKTDKYANILAKLLFESSPTGVVLTPLGQKLFEEIGLRKGGSAGFDAFIRYLRNGYGSHFSAVDTPEKMLKFLQKSAATMPDKYALNYRIKNELVAQITGVILSDKYFFEQVMKSAEPPASVAMYQLLSGVVSDPSVDANTKTLVRGLMQEYKDLTDEMQERFFKLYPVKASYSLADINEFVRIFTEGKYTTKAKLIEAYMKERFTNKERGEASIALDNIIYVASIYAKAAKSAAEEFIKLEKELTSLIDGAHYLLTSGASKTFNVLSPTFFSQAASLSEMVLKMLQGLRDGTLFSYALLESGVMQGVSGVELNKKNTVNVLVRLYKLDRYLDSLKSFLEELPEEVVKNLMPPGYEAEIDVLEMMIDSLQDELLKLIDEIEKVKELNYDFTVTIDAQGNPTTMIKVMYFAEKFAQLVNDSETFRRLSALRLTTKTNAQKTPTDIEALLSQKINETFATQIKLLNQILEAGIGKALDRIRSNSLQAKSPLSREMESFILNYRALKALLLEMSVKPTRTIKEYKELIVNALKEFAYRYNDVVSVKYDTNDQQELEQFADLIEGDITAFGQSIVTIFAQFAKLFGEDDILISVPDFIMDNKSLNAFMQSKDYINMSFNPRVVAKGFTKIVSLLETRYTSSLSDDTKTHEEYAQQIIQELTDAKSTGKYQKADLENSSLLTPQDYFLILMEKYGGVTGLFATLWNKYKAAVGRYEDIIVDFDKAYLSFKEANPDLQKMSIQTKLEMDYSMFVNIDPTDLKIILGEWDDIDKKQKAQVATINKSLKEIKELQEKQQKLVDDQKKVLAKKQRGSLSYKKEQAILRALQSELKKIKGEAKKIRSQKKLQKNQAIAKEIFIKERVAQEIAKGKKLDNTLTVGQIISLFLSISREVEMAESYKNAIANGEMPDIQPTNHFSQFNYFEAFDNELLRKKGLTEAKSKTRNFFILQNKKELLQYLRQLVMQIPGADIILQFANDSFNKNYELLNEEFSKRYKRNLPRQKTYIPFATINSEYARDPRLKLVKRNNAGVAQGLVTETTLGATTPLKIENIFAVIENHSRATARYSFDRLLKDVQNLWVNKAGRGGDGLTVSTFFKGTQSVVGTGNKFWDKFMQMFIDILGYNQSDLNEYEKFIQKRLRDVRAATLAFGVGSPIKQLGSIMNIAIKNQLNPVKLLKNVIKNIGFDLRRAKLESLGAKDIIKFLRKIFSSKFHNYLMDNNSNYYLRAKVSNIPDLASEINTSVTLRSKQWIESINKVGLLPMQLLDTLVLLAAFETIYDNEISKLKKQGLTGDVLEQTALSNANVIFQEVLLFGVANTSAAFRSPFSNNRTTLMQIVSKFQSENVLHISAIIRETALNRAGLKRKKKLLEELLAWLISGFYSALVNSVLAVAYGYTTGAALMAGEFIVQELLIDNLLGSIPFLNMITGLIRFEANAEGELVLRQGFEPRIPGFEQMSNIVRIIGTGFVNEDTGEFQFRKVLRILFEFGEIFGIGASNIDKMGRLIASGFASSGQGWAIDWLQWYKGTTNAQELTNAIQSGNSAYIGNFVEEAFGETSVGTHITNLLASDPTLRLSLKNEDYFIYTDEDGERQTMDIPSSTKTRYRRLTVLALRKLIRSSKYRKLKAKDKVAALQRVINYYWNYMKAYLLKEKRQNPTVSSVDEVVERSIYYAYN